ncbi:hypothetical protein ELI49_34650 [Rhizobium ruizarguesonis]|jgi:glyoxylase-like metal-dependent hydrolase (beta-lactamase superfamily II)|uniref:MBL fold metallo-hydrolase n=1 Tax=Rhizobium ruizarguesonis TaxID=2081791 RepID=A0AAE8Q4Y3_9HYPH|nr:hypothetical protein [Rhizobium ruizarguesonis]QIO49342.1 hypothetical protein HA464_35830 [Rhizobium leguminosarum bv. trifolii]QJS32470.1 hypothetical protein RLTA1_34930 [Rhizobium leguminosarum bv. trifolii TA1]QND37608.1 hypothetical protein HB771_03985 [Rhizobium leguminosarum bv. viciae]TAT71259.1 hypothetical protein ELI56_33070 [Rhizobium ruizarguesonis]TAT72463.1 hypothetical protein ELI52_33560 [Rhizobium ruizarguesonis]
MITRRNSLKLAVAAYGFAALAPTIVRAANGGLQWRYFQADAAGFGRTPVLLTSEREAILIDGGFTLPFGRDVAQAIKTTSKRLTTIYVSRSDPDYYFSLQPIVEAFPTARELDAKTPASSAGVEQSCR